jgi:hypothetical protein
VEAVAIVNQLPLSVVAANSSFDVEGRPAGTDINVADSQIISPDYFRAMGIPLVRGRFLSEADTKPTPTSVIVNQSKVWPGGKSYWQANQAQGGRSMAFGDRSSDPYQESRFQCSHQTGILCPAH